MVITFLNPDFSPSDLSPGLKVGEITEFRAKYYNFQALYNFLEKRYEHVESCEYSLFV